MTIINKLNMNMKVCDRQDRQKSNTVCLLPLYSLRPLGITALCVPSSEGQILWISAHVVLLFYKCHHSYHSLGLSFQGQDSPTLKLCYLSFQLVTFLLKTLLEEKTMIVELGESQPGTPIFVIIVYIEFTIVIQPWWLSSLMRQFLIQ